MKYKVLYAEDDPILAQIISDGLESSGYEVFKASNGRDALSIKMINQTYASLIL